MRLSFQVAVLLLSSLAFSQDAPPIATNQLTLPAPTVGVPIPPQPLGAAQVTGTPGHATYYFWLVSEATLGNSQPSNAIPCFNAPQTLSSQNYCSFTWNPSPGANSYDVLMTTTPQPPGGTGNFAVTTGTTSTSINVQSNSLSSYTVSTFVPNAYGLSLTNEGTAAATTHLILRQQPSNQFLADLTSGSGGSGTVNPGTATQIAYYPGTGTAVSGDPRLTDTGTQANYNGAFSVEPQSNPGNTTLTVLGDPSGTNKIASFGTNTGGNTLTIFPAGAVLVQPASGAGGPDFSVSGSNDGAPLVQLLPYRGTTQPMIEGFSQTSPYGQVFELDGLGDVEATSYQQGSSGPSWTSGAGAPSGTPAVGSLYSNSSGTFGLSNTEYAYTSSGWKGLPDASVTVGTPGVGGFFGETVYVPPNPVATVTDSTANQVTMMQFVLPFSAKVTDITVLTGGTSPGGSTANLGLYDCTGTNGEPGTKLVDSGALGIATTNHYFTATISTASVPLGCLYFAWSISNTTATLAGWTYAFGGNASYSGIQNQVYARAGFCANATSGGALPSACGTFSVGGINAVPVAWFEP